MNYNNKINNLKMIQFKKQTNIMHKLNNLHNFNNNINN